MSKGESLQSEDRQDQGTYNQRKKNPPLVPSRIYYYR